MLWKDILVLSTSDGVQSPFCWCYWWAVRQWGRRDQINLLFGQNCNQVLWPGVGIGPLHKWALERLGWKTEKYSFMKMSWANQPVRAHLSLGQTKVNVLQLESQLGHRLMVVDSIRGTLFLGHWLQSRKQLYVIIVLTVCIAMVSILAHCARWTFTLQEGSSALLQVLFFILLCVKLPSSQGSLV